MATPIEAVPILTGQSAVDFDEAAEKTELNHTNHISITDKENIFKILDRSKNFKFPWE